jgi:hypothetical protein
MINAKKSSFEYIIWLIKQYHQTKQTYANAIYKVIEVQKQKNGTPTLMVQVCGKNAIFKVSPQEILLDDRLLEGFSKQDIRNITYLACADTKPKSKIILQEFCERLNKIVFGVRTQGKEDLIKKTAAEISLDKDLLKNLSPEDAHMIGYLSADETNTERNLIKL